MAHDNTVIKTVSPREREEFFSAGRTKLGISKGSTEQIRLKRTTLGEMAAASGLTWTLNSEETGDAIR